MPQTLGNDDDESGIIVLYLALLRIAHVAESVSMVAHNEEERIAQLNTFNQTVLSRLPRIGREPGILRTNLMLVISEETMPLCIRMIKPVDVVVRQIAHPCDAEFRFVGIGIDEVLQVFELGTDAVLCSCVCILCRRVRPCTSSSPIVAGTT